MSLAAAALASCSDDLPSVPSDNTVDITVSIAGASRVDTDNPDLNASCVFSSGDKILLAATNTGQAPAVYTFNGNAWTHEITEGIVWRQDQMDITGTYLYHNFFDGKSVFCSNQTDLDSLRCSDQMTYQGTHHSSEKQINIVMRRLNARIVVNVDYSLEFNGREPAITNFVLLPGSAAVKPYNRPNTHTYVAVVQPGAVTDNVFASFTADGISYESSLSRTFEAGTSYTYNLTVGNDGVEISSINVEPWVEGSPLEGGDLNAE